jgi:glutamate-1-semialdehyde 2,1-aminomutase
VQVLNAGYDGIKFVDKAHGKYIWVDGKKCLDFAYGGGVHLFGNSPRFITNAVKRQLGRGTQYSTPNHLVYEYAHEFSKHIPSELDSMVFANTGSEAVMRAFRIARAFTGKDKIAIFDGCWHGSYDQTVWTDYPKGVWDSTTSIVRLPHNNDCFRILQQKEDIAMVFLEPFRGSNPDTSSEWMDELYNHCKGLGILLGWDEIISGFRYHATRHFSILPDLITYGKVIGGGFPIGVVAGKSDVMEKIREGVFMGGTFSANPISLTAGLEVMRRIDNYVLTKLDNLGLVLQTRVNNACTNISMVGVGSFLRLRCPDRERIIRNLLGGRVHLGLNGLVYLSTENCMDDVDKLVELLIEQDKIIG